MLSLHDTNGQRGAPSPPATRHSRRGPARTFAHAPVFARRGVVPAAGPPRPTAGSCAPPPPADAPRGRLDRFPPPGDSRQRLGSNTDGGGEERRHREPRATLQHPLGARCLDQLSPAGGRPISVWGEYRWGGGAPCCRAPRHPHGDPARARLYKGGGGDAVPADVGENHQRGGGDPATMASWHLVMPPRGERHRGGGCRE